MEKAPLQSTPVGAIRLNTDSSKLETYDGTQWVNLTTTSPRVHTGGTRGGIGGGYTPTKINNIEYQNLESTGNLIDFGDLSQSRSNPGCVSSRTRAVWCGGEAPSNVNTMDYITIASTGDATDFGDMDTTGRYLAGAGNQVRGILGAVDSSPGNKGITYVTIASTGTGTPDFGDLTSLTAVNYGAYANQTRYVLPVGAGEGNQANSFVNSVQIASTGNAIDWGTPLYKYELTRSVSNSVRGVTGGGRYPNPSYHTSLEYGIIASLGNQLEFGDLSVARGDTATAASPTRGVFMCGYPVPSTGNVCDYFEFASGGTAFDFGDVSGNRAESGGFSNGHGGLG